MQLPARVVGECATGDEEFAADRLRRIRARKEMVEAANRQFYLDECDKLDAYAEDLKEGLQREIKELGKAITAKKKFCRESAHLPLQDIIDMKDEINAMEKKRRKMQTERDKREEEIEMEKDKLQESIRRKMNGNTEVSHIMTISFEIV